jgi:hypothetical protein
MSSSKSSLRIVLVDQEGDVLFSGESLGLREGWSRAAADVAPEPEPCPETKRSPTVTQSGVYPVSRRAGGPRPLVEEEVPPRVRAEAELEEEEDEGPASRAA